MDFKLILFPTQIAVPNISFKKYLQKTYKFVSSFTTARQTFNFTGCFYLCLS